jgi:O-antigen ligase
MSVTHTINATVKKSGLTKEKIIYALIFLFPVAGVSVSHWFSGIFGILVLMSFWDFVRSKKRTVLYKEEKIWLYLCAGFCASYVLSGLVSGWDYGQTKALAVALRYLFVVPLYFMLRKYVHAWRYYFAGIVLAAIFLAMQAYYDVSILERGRASGFYSPNLLGPVAALVAVWLVAGIGIFPRLKWLIPWFVVGAIYAVVASGSRGAYLGLVAMFVLIVFFNSRGVQRVAALFFVGLLIVAAYFGSSTVMERVDTAVNETLNYWQAEDTKNLPLGSITWRFEIWTVAIKAFLESPIVGVGTRHYDIYSKKYAELGEINPAAVSDGDAHSAYFEILMSRGIIGVMFFAGMLFYPFYIFSSTYSASPVTAQLGMILVTGYAFFSLTDHSTFIMGNFTAIFLISMSVFLTAHIQQIKQKES